MEVTSTAIPDVKIIRPRVFADARGSFFESYNERAFAEKIGRINFVQDNQSFSTKGTLRGLHYQMPPFAQTKLVRVASGRVLDVAVDLREDSPTFLQSVAVELSEDNKCQLFIPRGFAHGFLVLSETAIFEYKVDNYYAPQSDRGIRFDDPELNIDWGVDSSSVLLSAKDQGLPLLKEAPLFSKSAGLYEA